MSDTELLTIGAFARACGLSASALRFYADAGVLVPAVVDETTGYRYYAPDQAATARLVQYLRAVDMPLPAVVTVLAEPDPARRAALVDDHLHALDHHLDAIRTAADAARTAMRSETIPTSLPVGGTAPETAEPSDGGEALRVAPGAEPDTAERRQRQDECVVRVRGPLLAGAVDQIATATVTDPDLPVLNSIHLEARGEDLVLTATDRYRLATRTLRTTQAAAAATPTADFGAATVDPTATLAADDLRAADIAATGAAIADWSATVDADDLRGVASWLRRTHTVCVRPGATHLELSADAAREDRRRCRRGAEEFPDYRAMLAALPPVTTRVVLNRAAALAALEGCAASAITLVVEPAEVRLGVAPMVATVAGPPMTIHFAVITLYPAVAGAVGPDVMVDLLAPDLPARIRSADDGDLLTLAMPCRPDHSEETSR
ncbi:MerR family transcriptional regulator [Nocardia asteroides]|uniref:DNA polymerase III subunit beta family protein n=1 Tax=Nocardia asteroides TaxID=1824 RepID=UPI003421C75A